MRVLLLIILCDLSSILQGKPLRTVLLSIGNEDSYKVGLPNLEYSLQDNLRIRNVFLKNGDVHHEDSFTANNISYLEFRSLIKEISNYIAKLSEEVKFVFYYTGHSDSDASPY